MTNNTIPIGGNYKPPLSCGISARFPVFVVQNWPQWDLEKPIFQ
jgi:hypothetical protein